MSNRKYKICNWLLAILSIPILAMSGCGNAGVERADFALNMALKESMAIDDPWVAFETLRTREESIYKNHKVCTRDLFGDESCQTVAAQSKVTAQRVQYLILAVEQSKAQALAYLYSTTVTTNDEYAQLRKASVEKLLAFADNASGAPVDGPALWRAGQVIAQGDATVLDADRALRYFARAWAAGQKQAADSAALLSLSLKDKCSAYLWSLRCTDRCQRDNAVSLAKLQQSLSTEALHHAQSLARSSTAICVSNVSAAR